MTSSMSVQLTPGQRCLLDLLQRKLLNTLQSYAKLSLEKQESVNQDGIELELLRLKEKIRRISARQKRFTLEIINGNGNNTIPKESFFKALGLVTKEALSKLNSKTNERRRRTTANPRFSHEAIQAKRALEPLPKRFEPRVSKDKREATKKPQRHQANNTDTNTDINTNNSSEPNNNSNNNNNNSNNNNNNSSSSNNSIANSNQVKGGNQQALNNSRNSGRSASNRGRNVIHDERRELLAQCGNLQRQIDSKVSQIKNKLESNKKLERQNEIIRKHGLDIINAINKMKTDITFQDNDQGQLSDSRKQSDQTIQPVEPLDIWIDMKCDESLDGLD